jgi:FKBP-type peptidyl-prolyl cis-trans isomerase
MGWRRGRLVLATLLLVTAPPLAAQELTLRTLSPLSSWKLSPRLGIVEDSLRSVGRGVWVRDLQAGNGEPADSGTVVEVHYVGQLADGRTFAATDRKPFAFRLGADQVIAGWEDGVLGMRVGGRRQLVIPPHLGYGAEGDGAIPPDAVLVFDVTVVDARRP